MAQRRLSGCCGSFTACAQQAPPLNHAQPAMLRANRNSPRLQVGVGDAGHEGGNGSVERAPGPHKRVSIVPSCQRGARVGLGAARPCAVRRAKVLLRGGREGGERVRCSGRQDMDSKDAARLARGAECRVERAHLDRRVHPHHLWERCPVLLPPVAQRRQRSPQQAGVGGAAVGAGWRVVQAGLGREGGRERQGAGASQLDRSGQAANRMH